MRKKKAIIFILLAAVIVSGSSGCAQLRDKFIRKPKNKDELKRYTVVRQYDVHPSIELYTKRYIFWKNWQRDLLDVLDNSNRKKAVVAVEFVIENLYDMKKMLVDEKAEELQKYIDRMLEIEKTIKTQRVTSANKVKLRRKIENTGRQIKMYFSYRKMGDYVRDDFKE